MNYILLKASYGKMSMEMVADTMQQPCNLLIKKKFGEWSIYSPEREGIEDETEPISPAEVLKILSSPDNRIINWGNHIFFNDSLFDLNLPKRVALASNKGLSRKILQNAGVAVPETWYTGFMNLWFFPCIARPSSHFGGKKFHILNSPEEYYALVENYGGTLPDWYFSRIFEKTHEFRVHCAHGKVLFINEKPLIEGEIRGNYSITEDKWRGLRWKEFNIKICQESLKAIDALGLDYGAVDIMYNAAEDDPDNSVAVCEVNTSPSLTSEYSVGKYAAYFDWVIRHKFPGHYPIDGKSVFYNKILNS